MYNFVHVNPSVGIYEFHVGIEMNLVAHLARQGNITYRSWKDPNSNTACEQALSMCLPADGSIIATPNITEDSLVAMAVFAARLAREPVKPFAVLAIANYVRCGENADTLFKDLIAKVKDVTHRPNISLDERIRLVRSLIAA